MRLGDLLLKEEAITEKQLDKALDYQKENPEVRIGVALVKFGFVDMKTLVGTLAKQNPAKTVTPEQLESLADKQESPAKEIAPKVSQAMKLGEILLKEKAVTPEQLREVVEYQQQHPDMMFGQALKALGFATEEVILAALGKQQESAAQGVSPKQGRMAVRLGEILLIDKVITEEQLRKALEYQRKYPRMMLGQALTNLGFATKKTISEVLRKMRRGD